MAIYGIGIYGQDPYGATAPTGFIVDPFTAQPYNYSTINLSWASPTGAVNEFRLLRNRFGYPVDQNDGEILLDVTSNWGNSFVDTKAVGGQYHYYGIYLLAAQPLLNPGWSTTTVGTVFGNYFLASQFINFHVGDQFTDTFNPGVTFTVTGLGNPFVGNVQVFFSPPALVSMQGGDVVTQITTGLFAWTRAGLTACLMPTNYGSGAYLLSLVPNDVKNIPLTPEVTGDAMSNSFLAQFLNVIGWGLDYLKTQYAVAAQANNPQVISLGNLMNLAAEIGYPFQASLPAGVMRKGIANSATAYKQRGTLVGIENEITTVTGWAAEAIVGYNMLLENDQAYQQDPVYPLWNATQVYRLNERVQYLNTFDGQTLVYQCLLAGTTGTAQQPSGNTSANTWWKNLGDFDEDTGALFTPNTGPLNQNWNFQGGWTGGDISRIGITPWTALNNATVALSTSWGYTGSNAASLVFTGNGTTANPQVVSEQFAVTPNLTYGAGGIFYSPQGWSTTQYGVNWFNSAGTYISTTYPAGANPFNAVAGVYQSIAGTVTAPGTAAKGQLVINMSGTPGSSVQMFAGLAYLLGPQGGSANTWEARYPSATGQVALPFSLKEGIGVFDPFAGTFNVNHGSIRVYNQGGSPQNVELKTVARTPADIAAGSTEPDPAQVIADSVPVPWAEGNDPDMFWSPTVEYEPNTTVIYQGQPYLAVRASIGAVPPVNTNLPSNDWQPLGLDMRLPLMVSSWASQSIPTTANFQTVVTPYAVWYDQWGKLITRVNARSPYTQVPNVNVATTAALPANTATSTTLTANVNSAFPAVDGVTLSTVGQTILVQNEATQANNGIYSLTTVGSGSVKWVLTRTSTPNTAYVGLVVQASFGTVNGNVLFYCTNTTAPTFGTTAITFSSTAPYPFQPLGLYYDSFTNGWGAPVAGSQPDIGASTWNATSGSFITSPFQNGTATPASTGTRSGLIFFTTGLNSMVNCQIGLTLVTNPPSGWSEGIMFRQQNDSNYWRADQFGLGKNVAGTFSFVAYYPQVFQPGDRMVVQINGNVLTVLRNGVQVAQVTDAFLNGQANHGIIYELTTPNAFPSFMRGARPTRTRPARLLPAGRRLTFIVMPVTPQQQAPPQFIDPAGPRPMRFTARLLSSRGRYFTVGLGQSSQGAAFPTAPKQRKRPAQPAKRRR